MRYTAALALIITTMLCQPAQADDAWQLAPAVREKSLTVLRAAIHADDFWPAIHAAEALTLAGYPQEVHDVLQPKLNAETDDQRRCGLARELVRAGDRQRSEVMLGILRKANPHGHVHAAESLYKVGWVGEAAPLEQAAQSDDIRLRLMASAALARHAKGSARADAFAVIRQTLRDETDPAVFRLAAWVLGRIGEDKDRALIRARLQDANDDLVRAFLQHALAALGDEDGRRALLDNFQSNDPAIRTYAAVFAGESKIFAAAPFLIRQLEDDNLDARVRAAQALFVLAQ